MEETLDKDFQIQPELVFSEELINDFFKGFRSPINIRPIDFLEHTLIIAIKNGIELNLPDAPEVEYPGTSGIMCAGYFTGTKFACAMGKPTEEWLPIFAHESCHMDQYLEDPIKWKEYDIIDQIDPWLEGKIELTPEQLKEVIDKVIELELDCERRTVAKIYEWELELDLNEYIKRANAYLFFYRFVQLTRTWYGGVNAFYRNPEIVSLCPDTFLESYETVPQEILDKMLEIHEKRQKDNEK